MSRPPRFVTLSPRVLRFQDERGVADLLDYLDPAFVVAENPLPDEAERRLASLVDGPVMSKSRETPAVHRTGSAAVAWVSEPGDVGELAGFDGAEELVVVTDLIEEDVDMRSFETTLTHIEAYGRGTRDLDAEATHFSTGLPAGTRHREHGVTVHGAGVQETLEGTAIPCLSPGAPLGLEALDAEKTGLQAIPGLGGAIRRRLESEGIERRRGLAERGPAGLMAFEGIGPYYAARFAAGARAHAEGRPFRYADDPLRNEDLVYVDIETDGLEDPSLIWQIGVYDERSDSYRCFLEDEDPHDAASTVVAFAEWLDRELGDASLVAWYGDRFDYVHLGSFIAEHADAGLLSAWEEATKHDLLLDVVKQTCAVPARSHQLEVVADRLGFERETRGVSGKDAAEAVIAWRNGGEEPDWERWIRYCREDVMAMTHVYDELREAEKLTDRGRLEERYDVRAR